jgi:hypothetical protein
MPVVQDRQIRVGDQQAGRNRIAFALVDQGGQDRPLRVMAAGVEGPAAGDDDPSLLAHRAPAGREHGGHPHARVGEDLVLRLVREHLEVPEHGGQDRRHPARRWARARDLAEDLVLHQQVGFEAAERPTDGHPEHSGVLSDGGRAPTRAFR